MGNSAHSQLVIDDALESQANKVINSGRVQGTFQQLVGKSQREEGSDRPIITVITGRGGEEDQEE